MRRALAIYMGLLFTLFALGAAGAREDYRACKQKCRNIRDRCKAQCSIEYPGDANRAIRNECKAICEETKDRCVDACRAIRDGESPNEP